MASPPLKNIDIFSVTIHKTLLVTRLSYILDFLFARVYFCTVSYLLDHLIHPHLLRRS